MVFATLGALALLGFAGCSGTSTTTTTPAPAPAGEAGVEAGAGADTGPLTDATPPAADAGRPDSEAGAFDAGPITACYDATEAFILENAKPVRAPSLCTNAAIVEARTACLSPSSTKPGCDAFIAATKACARCVFGGLEDDDPAKVPVGAILPLSLTAVAPNVGACAALVIGRAECAVPVSRELVCVSTACATCPAGSSTTACHAQATDGICKGVGDAACSAAIDASSAQWLPQCSGTTFADAFDKVARVLCGAP